MGRLGLLLRASWGLLGRLGYLLGASWGVLGGILERLGVSWGVLGASWGVLGRLGGLLGCLGASWGRLGAALGHLGAALGTHARRYVSSWPEVGRKLAQEVKTLQEGRRRSKTLEDARRGGRWSRWPWGGDLEGGQNTNPQLDLTRRTAACSLGRRGAADCRTLRDHRPPPTLWLVAWGLSLAPWKKWSDGSSQCVLSVLSLLLVHALFVYHHHVHAVCVHRRSTW